MTGRVRGSLLYGLKVIPACCLLSNQANDSASYSMNKALQVRVGVPGLSIDIAGVTPVR